MLMIPAVILAIDTEEDRTFMTDVYTKHHALMFKVAWSYVHTLQEAEDIVSDSCVSLIKKVDKLQTMQDNELRKYIVITVRNTATNLWNKKQRENAKFLKVDEEVLEQLPSDTSSVERRIDFEEELEHVRSAIHALPERDRRILQLKFFEEKSDHEICETTGMTASNVRKTIERARKHLKMKLYQGEKL